MNEQTPDMDPRTPALDDTQEKDEHVATILKADRVLEEADRGIRIARRRLQAVVRRYEERARAPR